MERDQVTSPDHAFVDANSTIRAGVCRTCGRARSAHKLPQECHERGAGHAKNRHFHDSEHGIIDMDEPTGDLMTAEELAEIMMGDYLGHDPFLKYAKLLLDLREALVDLNAAINSVRKDLGTQFPVLSEKWVLARVMLARADVLLRRDK